MIKTIKCIQCLNQVSYNGNCNFQCPYCGYSGGWENQESYQLGKENNNGNISKVQMQYPRMGRRENKNQSQENDKRFKKINEKIHIKSWK